MSFNLNVSRKPERQLDENLTHEMIQIYGLQCKWLYSERVNSDKIFQDFSHFRVGEDYLDVTLKPEVTEDFEGENSFNSFGFYTNLTTNLFISKRDILRLYPDFLDEVGQRALVVNSLILLPAGIILEITNVESYTVNVNNQWGYADDPSSYRLTCKVYSNNISDEGISDIKTNIVLKEGPQDSVDNERIFEYDEEIETKEIDEFFDTLETKTEYQNKKGDEISDSGGVFGNLG